MEVRTRIAAFLLIIICGSASCEPTDPTPVEEEIQSMREEIAELKAEARDTLIKALGETASAGVTAASGLVEIAIFPLYFASKDVVIGCATYNEAMDLERRVDALEELLYEDQMNENSYNEKGWWEFWK